MKQPKVIETIPYKIASSIGTWIGDQRLSGYITSIKYEDIDINDFKVGDIILNRTNWTFTSALIPGYWSHAAIYVGDGKVVEALSDGVVCHSVYNCLGHCDSYCILRPVIDLSNDENFINAIISHIGKLYDFFFKFSKNGIMSCTEVVYVCYSPYPLGIKLNHKGMLYPDDIYYNEFFECIKEIRK